MRHGIVILTDLPWREARPRWEAAEALGFDHAWTYDHLVWGGLPEAPWTGAFPALAAAAMATTSIGLGTFVASPNYRHPYVLLRDSVGLADISSDRFLLGLGTGGDGDAQRLGELAVVHGAGEVVGLCGVPGVEVQDDVDDEGEPLYEFPEVRPRSRSTKETA